ncbi:MAG: 4-hydroxybenzoate octaprenyltransferase [Rhodospirillales bacterium]|jgi:4-hydroxybenzoate polyprenyltransferase|nr:4-hydroxybenzoate octaprenyltransferase [Rhodospirillales bacterium]
MNEPAPNASDIPVGNWIDRYVPMSARAYFRLARMDRPIGTWLLLIPCWWGVALASTGWPDPFLIALFAVGSIVMRAAGCTINDIADRDFDARVARTADRPIASGKVSMLAAVVFLAGLLAVGLLVLLQFNVFAVWVGITALPFVAAYPFMKRFTYWPQAWLGLTFNWGALLGWAAVNGDLAAPAALLYVAGISWTLGYDTIYAHQDKEDDLIVGVKSSALRLGETTRPWLFGFFAVTILLLSAGGSTAGLGWPYFVGVAFGAAHLAWQAKTVDIDDAKDCLRKFKSNRDFGLIIFAGIVAAKVIA